MEVNLPIDFITFLEKEYGATFAEALKSIIASPSPTTIRVNPSKVSTPLETLDLPIKSSLQEFGRSRYGYVLSSRPIFTLDPLFHAGAYYVQEASSMAIESQFSLYKGLLDDNSDGKLRILDLCAAPGGKSTHLLSIFANQKGVMLVANEVIRQRATVLAENIVKWGASNVVVTNNDPSDFKEFGSFFDMVVVDAPCSGEGMFRKDRDSIGQWSIEGVAQCAARQRRILKDIWGALRDGGILLYSTCTYNRSENGENLEWIVKELGGELLFSEQYFPGEEFGEGFFFSLVRKGGNSAHSTFKSVRKVEEIKDRRDLKFVKPEYFLCRKGDTVKGYPINVANDLLYLESKLRVITGGVAVATIIEGGKGASYIPKGDVALSDALVRGVFPEVDLYSPSAQEPSKQAIRYLKREPLTFNGHPKGYLLITYKGIPLGFVKNIGARANNLWNINWRIRI